jgi:ribosome-binding protein aMBF1 (putative translation factor)
MRNLVQPPLSLRCELCGGELRFKWIEPADRVFDAKVEIFVCVKCGRAHSHRMPHDPYAARAARSSPRGKEDRPSGAGGDRYS